jgi:hypothetical protein
MTSGIWEVDKTLLVYIVQYDRMNLSSATIVKKSSNHSLNLKCAQYFSKLLFQERRPPEGMRL